MLTWLQKAVRAHVPRLAKVYCACLIRAHTDCTCEHNHIDQHMIILHPTIMHSVLSCTVYRLRKLCNLLTLEPRCLIAGMGYCGV